MHKRNNLFCLCKKKEKISQYKGVYWRKESEKWYAYLILKGFTHKYGGCFNDELEAARKVNQLCEEMKIPPQNPEIAGMSNQQSQVTQKLFYFNIF